MRIRDDEFMPAAPWKHSHLAQLRPALSKRYPPERSCHFFQRSARFVGLQSVAQQRNDVGAHLRIGNEVAVAEEVCCPADLDDVDRAQQGDRFDLVSAEHRRVDPPEPGDAAEQPARRRERLVVGRNVEGDPEARRRGDDGARVRFPAERQVGVGEHFEDLGQRDVAVEVGSDEDNIADVKLAIRRAAEHVGFGARARPMPMRECPCRGYARSGGRARRPASGRRSGSPSTGPRPRIRPTRGRRRSRTVCRAVRRRAT